MDEDALALDVIAEVMGQSRNFLREMHTVTYLRGGEVLQPRLARRDSYTEWVAADRPGLAEEADDKALKLLASHEVPPLTEEQQVALKEVVRAAAQKSPMYFP